MSARENLTLGRPETPSDRRRDRGGARDRPGRLRPRPARGASTPGSASRACRCPAVSGSGSRSPGRCWRSPPSWCSTTRCRRSTSTPRRWSRRRCAGCWPTPPASSSPTARRPCCSPTRSRCSRTARSPTSATHPELLATVPAYRELLAADPSLEEAALMTADPQVDASGAASRRPTTDERIERIERKFVGGSGTLLRELLRPHKWAIWVLVGDRAGRERRAALDPLPGQGGHRQRHPAHRRPTTASSRCS